MHNVPWPVDFVERVPVEDLTPYAGHPRAFSDDDVEAAARVLDVYGFTMPILRAEDGSVIVGAEFLAAACRRGLPDVPCATARGWSEAQCRAYRIAWHKLAERGTWSREALSAELEALREAGFDLSATLCSQADLDALLSHGTTGATDPDDAPDAPAAPVSRPGDLWRLGDHRLICGDACNGADVGRVLAGAQPHLMVTDPPYGVDYDPASRVRLNPRAKGRALGKVANDGRADWRAAWAHFPGRVAYVWHSALHAPVVAASLEACKLLARAQIVWVKNRPAIGRGAYHWAHEPCLYAVAEGADDDGWRFVPEHECASYAVRKGATAEWKGGRRQSTVWHIECVRLKSGHGTQKPVECMRRPILNNSAPGDLVYDPFHGSGTTTIAAEGEGRRVAAVEIDPAYVDVAVRRWQEFTAREATLDGDGRTFAEVAAARAAEAGAGASAVVEPAGAAGAEGGEGAGGGA